MAGPGGCVPALAWDSNRMLYAMRTTAIACDRCGAVILGGHSILRVEAGDLATVHDSEPCLDLCRECSERFRDFLQAGRIRPDATPIRRR
jgi:hypothetical protein